LNVGANRNGQPFAFVTMPLKRLRQVALEKLVPSPHHLSATAFSEDTELLIVGNRQRPSTARQ
jgi:hypothetical protein